MKDSDHRSDGCSRMDREPQTSTSIDNKPQNGNYETKTTDGTRLLGDFSEAVPRSSPRPVSSDSDDQMDRILQLLELVAFFVVLFFTIRTTLGAAWLASTVGNPTVQVVQPLPALPSIIASVLASPSVLLPPVLTWGALRFPKYAHGP